MTADYRARPPKTKVVCTLGVNCDSYSIRQLIVAGMNVARINPAFGTASVKN